MSLVYLGLDDLLAASRAFLGAEPVVRDFGLLDSALARPRAAMYGVQAYPSLDKKAAALLHSLVKNHALEDGNKRLGFVAVALFYGLNGHRLTVGFDEAYDLVIGVADGSIDDVPTITRALSPTKLNGGEVFV